MISRDEQKADPALPRLHRNLVAAIEQHEGSVVRLVRPRNVGPPHTIGGYRERRGCSRADLLERPVTGDVRCCITPRSLPLTARCFLEDL